VKAYPELADEIKGFIRGYVISGSIPGAVMGVGMVFGGVPTLLHFFNPKDLNPFVLAWHFMFIASLIFDIIWIFFKDGAEFISKHHDIFQYMPSSPLGIKVFAVVGSLAALAAVIFMCVIVPSSYFTN
jgi:hypothetical protein